MKSNDKIKTPSDKAMKHCRDLIRNYLHFHSYLKLKKTPFFSLFFSHQAEGGAEEEIYVAPNESLYTQEGVEKRDRVTQKNLLTSEMRDVN